MKYIVSLEGPEKLSWEICPENLWTSVKILADLQLSLRSSGTIFTDPQGKLAHRSLQILKESSTWEMLNHDNQLLKCQENFFTWVILIRTRISSKTSAFSILKSWYSFLISQKNLSYLAASGHAVQKSVPNATRAIKVIRSSKTKEQANESLLDAFQISIFSTKGTSSFWKILTMVTHTMTIIVAMLVIIWPYYYHIMMIIFYNDHTTTVWFTISEYGARPGTDQGQSG